MEQKLLRHTFLMQILLKYLFLQTGIFCFFEQNKKHFLRTKNFKKYLSYAKIYQNISIKFRIDTSGVIHFYLAFYTYLDQIRSKLVRQVDLRSKCLYFEIHEIFQ